jgi:uncharacterized protein YuzE
MYAYYDPDADIVWLPIGESQSVVSKEVEWGLVDHDAATDRVVAVEIWTASECFPQGVLGALPGPGKPSGAAA